MTGETLPLQTRRVWRYPAGEDGWRSPNGGTVANNSSSATTATPSPVVSTREETAASSLVMSHLANLAPRPQ